MDAQERDFAFDIEVVSSKKIDSLQAINIFSADQLERYFGIEKIVMNNEKITIMTPVYSTTNIHLVGAKEKNAAFIFPVGKSYDARLIVSIEEHEEVYEFIIEDYLNIKEGSNMMMGRNINVYNRPSIGGVHFEERLYAEESPEGMVFDGFNNAYAEYKDYVTFRVPKDTEISRVELEHNIFFNDALIYGFRQNQIDVEIPSTIY